MDITRGRNINVIYGVVDLHYLRLLRQADYENNDNLRAQAASMRQLEYGIMGEAQKTITYSIEEETIIKTHDVCAEVHTIGWEVPIIFKPTAFEDRTGIAFVGGYKHTPNIDAAHTLVNTVMPLVWMKNPDIICILAGSDMPQSIRDLQSEKVKCIGFVDDIADFLGSVRITVAPLNYGAGLKGKVLSSLAAGVPAIITPTAAEGISLPDEMAALIERDVEGIANKIAELYDDVHKLSQISKCIVAFVSQNYSQTKIETAMSQVFTRTRDLKSSEPCPHGFVEDGATANRNQPHDKLQLNTVQFEPSGRTSPKLVVVDIGAAGGLQNRWENSEHEVVPILFEPNKDKAAELRQIKAKGISDPIVIDSALSNRIGEATIYMTKSLECWSLRPPNQRLLSKYSIEQAFYVKKTDNIDVTTYADLHRRGMVPSPDVIKIDVQGFEYEVLLGFGDLLGKCLAIQLEAHIYPIYSEQKLFQDIVNLLSDFGHSVRRLSPTGKFDGDVVELDVWLTADIARVERLSEVDKKKLLIIEREWNLKPRHREFNPAQWDYEWT